MVPLLVGGGGGGIGVENFLFYLRSVPGVSFQSSWSCSIFPFFSLLNTHVILCLTPVNRTSALCNTLKAWRGGSAMSAVACFSLLQCLPRSRFCLVAQRSSPRGGEGRCVTRQKWLQGRVPFAKVGHNYPDSIAEVCFASWLVKRGRCNLSELKWMD